MDLCREAGTSRSLRRGVNDYATNMQVNPKLVETVHRWSRETKSQGGHVKYTIPQQYSSLSALLPTFYGILYLYNIGVMQSISPDALKRKKYQNMGGCPARLSVAIAD